MSVVHFARRPDCPHMRARPQSSGRQLGHALTLSCLPYTVSAPPDGTRKRRAGVTTGAPQSRLHSMQGRKARATALAMMRASATVLTQRDETPCVDEGCKASPGTPLSASRAKSGGHDGDAQRVTPAWCMGLVEDASSFSRDFQSPGEDHSPGTIRPPPTPRFERLPSPDLDELEQDVSFCSCCSAWDATATVKQKGSRDTFRAQISPSANEKNDLAVGKTEEMRAEEAEDGGSSI